jgi:hypothetical protein
MGGTIDAGSSADGGSSPRRLFVVDSAKEDVFLFDDNGRPLGALGSAVLGGRPADVRFGADGSAYVAIADTASVLRFDVSGQFLGTAITSHQNNLPGIAAIAFAPATPCLLWLLNSTGSGVWGYDCQGANPVRQFDAGPWESRFMIAGPGSSLLLTDALSEQMFALNTVLGGHPVFGDIVTDGLGPLVEAMSPLGHVVFVGTADTDSIETFEFETGQHVGTLVAPPPAGTQIGLAGLALGPNTTLLVSSRILGEVLQYRVADGLSLGAFVARGTLVSPAAMAFGP